MKRIIVHVYLGVLSLFSLNMAVAMERGPHNINNTILTVPTGQNDASERPALSEASTTSATSRLAQVKKYINLRSFLSRLVCIYFDMDDKIDNLKGLSGDSLEERKKEIHDIFVRDFLYAIVDALYLGNMPVNLGQAQGDSRTLERYVNSDNLKFILRMMISDYFQAPGSLRAEQVIFYLQRLQLSLRSQALNQDFPLLRLASYIDKAIEYLRSGKITSIDDCIDIEKIAEACGINLSTYFDVKKVKMLIQTLLQRKSVTKELIFDCIKFQPLLEWMGCQEEDINMVNQWAHALIELAFEFVNDEGSAVTKALTCMTLARHDNLVEIILQSPEKLRTFIALLRVNNIDACALFLRHENAVALALAEPAKFEKLLTALNPEKLEAILGLLDAQQKAALEKQKKNS